VNPRDRLDRRGELSPERWLARFDDGPGPDEADVKELLSLCGLATPASLVVRPGETAVPRFSGPYAVKVVSPRILHKTEAGALRLNVAADRLRGVVAELAAAFPGESILVEEMVPDVETEMIAGATRDTDLGLAIAVGAGGVLAEVYRDVTFRLVPCSRDEIDRMLDELRLAPLLSGYRGSTVDRDGLCEYLVAFADLVARLGDRLVECDINPLCYSAGRWLALDAKMVIRPPGSSAGTPDTRAG
jgi:hypothetical protein